MKRVNLSVRARVRRLLNKKLSGPAWIGSAKFWLKRSPPVKVRFLESVTVVDAAASYQSYWSMRVTKRAYTRTVWNRRHRLQRSQKWKPHYTGWTHRALEASKLILAPPN